MKFSIRDLLLVTVIVALAVGWWVDHRKQAEAIKTLRQDFEALQSRVGLWYELPTSQAPAPNPPKP
jgi:hypothetical protein